MNLADGIVPARYRNSLTRPELLEPGEVYGFVILTANTSDVFLEGHRIRLEISSSNFPRFPRNADAGNEPEKETSFTVAHQAVYHARERPSCVLLPVRKGLNYSAVAK